MADHFVLFDDLTKATARLYRDPVGEIVATGVGDVTRALADLRIAVADGQHAAGFLAYEAGHALEGRLIPLARQRGGLPLLWFGLFGGYQQWSQEALAALLGDPAGARLGAPRPRISRGDYLQAASAVREHLFAGDLYQANLTFQCDVAFQGAPLAAYAGLRSRARAGWGGVVRHPGGWLLSASPEQFFTLSGGLLEARPMKGTAARGADAAADRAAIDALRADPKQRAENLMIVDLLRNDLARVAEPGSVEVPELFAVETYPTVHQMVSRVTARLAAGRDSVDVIEALFPCGSITGAPKIAAIERLRALEGEPRGAYTGSMGWLDPNGDAAFNVMIRTLELGDGAPTARLGLGSGLVVDSIGGDEWDECLLKGKFVASAGDEFDLVETMRFDPAHGIDHLEAHLDRLTASAGQLDFRFDRHAARNELQAATFKHSRPAMLRMLLSPKGSMAIELKPLPQPPAGDVRVAIVPLPVDPADLRLRHKTTARRFYEDARAAAGTFEVLFELPDGQITEGSFTNLFVARGDGVLETPPLALGLLPGVLRTRLVDSGQAVERPLTRDDLENGFLIGNSVRGLLPARLA